ncbi:metallophosphoesterase family protein [bacterium]|nr:metallophosphoesterase family protein [bacterium]
MTSETMNIMLLSDLHDRTECVPIFRSLMITADIVVLAGDLTTRGQETHIRKVLEALQLDPTKTVSVHGNMDGPEAISFLEREGLSIHGHSKLLKTLAFTGLGGSNKTPLHTPTEYEETELEQYLETGWCELDSSTFRRILVSHVPPHGTCDRTFFRRHVGSTAVRDFIEHHQPILCLCGHIHEARGAELLGTTVVVNAGSAAAGNCALIRLDFERDRPIEIAVSLYQADLKKKELHTLEQYSFNPMIRR